MFIGLGIAVSVDQLETIFGIVLLTVQILIIVVKTSMSIYQKIKEKRYSEIKEDLEDAKTQIEEVTKQKNGREDTKS